MKSSYFGLLSLIAAAFIFATFGMYIRVLNNDLNTFQQIFFRGMLGFAIAGLFSAVTKKRFNFTGISKKILIGYVTLFPLTVILFTFSILSTKLATTLFGFYLGTLSLSLIIGVKFFHEPINHTKKLALGLAFAGLLSFTYPLSFHSFNLGLILSLIAGMLDAVSNALRKHLTNKIDRTVLVTIQLFGMGLIALPFVLLTIQNGIPTISPLSWIVGIWFGLMLIAVNYLLLYGFSHFDLNLGSIVLSSELFFTGVIGFMVYKEVLKPQEIVGLIFIFLAMATTSVNVDKLLKKFKK